MTYFNEARQKARELYYPPPKTRKTKSKNMATKIKAPPKLSSTEVHALLNKPSSKGYAPKMAKLLEFLQATTPIRTGAEIVERDISIEQDGTVRSFENVKNDFVNDKMRAVHFHVKEEKQLEGEVSSLYGQISECSKIIYSKAKANTDEKKEKARKKSDDLKLLKDEAQTKLNDLRTKIEGMKDDERNRLLATDFPIKSMRETLMLYEGVKIRVNLQTGSYTFPVPVGTPFYREVCNILGLPLDNMEAEKPVIKRMFTLPMDVLQAIKTAAKFASTDDLRPAMTCVVLEINDGNMLVVATDAHRLFKSRQFEVSGPPGQYNYLLPVSALRRLPKAVNEDFTLYELKGDKVGICGITIDLMDARFPDWKVVMPKYESGVTFDRLDMIAAIKNTLPYTNKSTGQINFNFNGEILISSQDIDFNFETSNRMRYLNKTMEDLVIAFNGRFFIEALNTFKEEEILFQGETPTRAGILTNGQDTVLIMPLMIGY